MPMLSRNRVLPQTIKTEPDKDLIRSDLPLRPTTKTEYRTSKMEDKGSGTVYRKLLGYWDKGYIHNVY